MARSTTGVHYTAIVFAMLFLVSAAMAYYYFREYSEVSAEANSARQEFSQEQTARRKLDDEIQELKKLIGHELSTVGVDNPDDPSTVIGRGREELQSLGGNLAQENYSTTLIAMDEELDNMSKERDALQADLNAHKETILSLQGQYQTKVDEYLTAMQNAEADREAAQRTLEESVAVKDRRIAALNERLNETNLLLQEEQKARQDERQQATGRIARLTDINTKLRDEKEERENLSFETPDGHIEYVDYNTNLVWINLGSADNLPKRLTFSVYRAHHQGVGRGPEDIKGAIEVTRILGDHLSEARIRWDDNAEPIGTGDEIYTPLWSRNYRPRFSIVGLIDFDEDGQSDRDFLHDLIEAAGGMIDNEIDDRGNADPDPPRLDVKTKFLVVGELPEYNESKPQDLEAHKQIWDHHGDMMNQAREQGVRVLTLQRLLNYMGYRPRRRLWVPGGDVPWKLKSGARSVAVDRSPTPPRASTGTTSGIYRAGGREQENNDRNDSPRSRRGSGY